MAPHIGMVGQRLRIAFGPARRDDPAQLVIRRRRDAEIHRRIGPPEPVQMRQTERPDVVRAEHDRLVRHAAILEYQRVAARRAHAEHVPVRDDPPPGASRRDQQQDAGRRRRRILGIGEHHHVIGRFEHRGEHLAPGDAVAAGDAPRPCAQAAARRSARYGRARKNCRRSAFPAARPDRRCAP